MHSLNSKHRRHTKYSTTLLLSGLLAPGCSAFSNSGNDSTADETGSGGSGTAGGQEVTIYQIQGGEIPENTIVTLKGKIVTSPFQETEGALFVQEPDGGEYSGIYVFFAGAAGQGVNLQPGDVLDLTGEYTEFFGTSEITISDGADAVVTGSASVPTPAVVDPADVTTGGALAEAYEGVLVRVENVVCTDPDPGFGEFIVTGGLAADDFFFATPPMPALDDTFDAIVGPMHFAFDEHKILPRTLADLEGWAGDGDGDSATTTGGDGDATIYEIQDGMVPVDSTVTVTGAIVTTPLTFDQDMFWIQDSAGGPRSGIAVYLANTMVTATVAPGDVVTITGQYREFFGLSELALLNTADLMVTGTAPVPAAAVLAAADIATMGAMAEDYEGVLVSVEGVSVVDNMLGFGEFSVTGGLRVDDLFFDPATYVLPNNLDTFTSITGPLNYAFDEFKLEPRTPADLVP